MENKIVDGLYSEKKDAGNKYRVEQLEQLHNFIERERMNADIRRINNFKPDFSTIEKYNESVDTYRQKFINMLGFPLCNYTEQLETPIVDIEFVSEDNLGSIYRLKIEVHPQLTTYGILFLPKGKGPHPLIIAQHGGGDTPEVCSGFFEFENNYNDMVRRVLRKDFAVFAPQLLLWKEAFGPDTNRNQIDIQLKQLGGSIASLEVYKLKRSIDYLVTRKDIDANHIGMMGLSYGGFYTLFTTASDIRIKAALSSCFFNNRFKYDWEDFTWFNSGNTFLDAEVCALICPRPLYIEVAKNDELFDIQYVESEYEKVKNYYEKLGRSNSLKLKKFEGIHELDTADDGIDFLCEMVKGM